MTGTGGGIDQGQLDQLFTAALEAGIARIEKDGHFFPLVFELRSNGVIHNVAVLDAAPISGSEGGLGRLSDLLRSRAQDGLIRAAAIVRHCTETARLFVQLRAPNYSQDVEVPFALSSEGLIRRRRRLSLGECTSSPAENTIF